jgi:hypothetical protein
MVWVLLDYQLRFFLWFSLCRSVLGWCVELGYHHIVEHLYLLTMKIFFFFFYLMLSLTYVSTNYLRMNWFKYWNFLVKYILLLYQKPLSNMCDITALAYSGEAGRA